jgi:hypothetical protein
MLHVRAQQTGSDGRLTLRQIHIIGGTVMHRHTLLTKPVAAAAALATTATTAVLLGTVSAGPAAACGAPTPSTRPISADAPYDSPFTNSGSLRLPAVTARPGTDYGHLPRWKHYADGRVLLREDRVTLRRSPDPLFIRYTNVNPRLRSYWLDRDVVIRVRTENYDRMTGHAPGPGPELRRVSRQQFLDSFHTDSSFERLLKYRAVYRLTFDASHTHVRAIEELPAFYGC